MMEMGIESQPRPKAHKNATTDTIQPPLSSFSGISTWGKRVGRKFDQIKLGESSEKLHYVVNHAHAHHHQRRPLSPASSSGLPHCSASVSELMIGLTSEADHLCDDESERRQVCCCSSNVERGLMNDQGRSVLAAEGLALVPFQI